MLDMRRSFTQVASLHFIAMLLLLLPHPSPAQTTPSADQVELFRNMTPEQQDAILKQLSGGGGNGSSPEGDLQGQGQGAGRQSSSNSTDLNKRRQSNSRSPLPGEQQSLIPLLKPEDW